MPSPDDHRSRTAARRRGQTRGRLIEAAVVVFARDGADSALIERVVQHAGLARGSFYNHFRSTQELLAAARQVLLADVVALILDRTAHLADPAERAAAGLGLFLHLLSDYPVLARFTRNLGLDADGPAQVVEALLTPALAQGVASGRFADAPPRVLAGLLSGAVLAHVLCTTGDAAAAGARPHLVAALLRAFGIAAPEAAALAARDHGALVAPEGSLLARTRTTDSTDTAEDTAP
ncbi:MAG: TetR/AcrR family transcriptional regulator [Rubellimicrobium sp.]|nr:TetR/AcrR family transcriptional regulator [Rubellimicrobium sp.]